MATNFPRTKTLTVRAAKADKPVPMARSRRHLDSKTGRDRNKIYADTPVEVPNVRYYRRRVQTGELLLVAAPVTPKASRPTKAKE
jgi:hypothetical protein